MAALHEPVILFTDVVGKAGTTPPAQMVNDVPNSNVGVMFGATVTANVAFVAHNPAVGVNVYVAEAWLLTAAGLHVPVIPFSEVEGKLGTVPSAQIVSDVPKSNVGITFGLMVTVNVVGVAHNPAVGVKV